MNDIGRCDYCGRGQYLSGVETCRGCGSPYPPVPNRRPLPPDAIETQRIFNALDAQRFNLLACVYDASKIRAPLFGTPSKNISIIPLAKTSLNRSRLGEVVQVLLQGAAGAAGRFGR
jgi:hypothetical protein